MTGTVTMDDRKVAQTEWEARADAAARRRIAIWVGVPVVGVVAIIAFAGGMVVENRAASIALMAVAATLLAGAFAWGTAIYMQTVDEQERDANLWGCYVGMCLYLLLYIVRAGIELATGAAPFSHDVIFLATMVAVLAVFAWKRFR